jgi:hypothetical protein
MKAKSNLSRFKMPRRDVVGIGSTRNTIRFDGVEIVEITGQGKLLDE